MSTLFDGTGSTLSDRLPASRSRCAVGVAGTGTGKWRNLRSASWCQGFPRSARRFATLTPASLRPRGSHTGQRGCPSFSNLCSSLQGTSRKCWESFSLLVTIREGKKPRPSRCVLRIVGFSISNHAHAQSAARSRGRQPSATVGGWGSRTRRRVGAAANAGVGTRQRHRRRRPSRPVGRSAGCVGAASGRRRAVRQTCQRFASSSAPASVATESAERPWRARAWRVRAYRCHGPAYPRK